MNNTQRKFLIEKIQEKTRLKIDILKNSRINHPNASNYFFKAIMNDTLEIQSVEVIKEALKKKALNARDGENWLSGERMGWEKERVVKIDINDLLVLPDDYHKEVERVNEHNKSINKEINELSQYLDTIEMRIQLSSDKTLQAIINDIDDMGDIRLIDSNLKLLNK